MASMVQNETFGPDVGPERAGLMRPSRFESSLLNLSACLLAGVLLFTALGAQAQGLGQTPTKKTTPKKQTKVKKKPQSKPTATKMGIEKPVVRTIIGPGKARKGPTIRSKDLTLPTMVVAANPAGPSSKTNPTQTANTTPTQEISQAPQKRWSAMGALSRSTSLYDHQDSSRRDSADIFARLSLRVTDEWTASTAISHSSDLNYTEYTGFGDVSLSIGRRGMPLGEMMTWAPNFSGTFPTSKNSQIHQNLLFAGGASLSISMKPDVLPAGLSLGFGIGLTRLVHQYEESTTGRVNTQWSSRQSVSIGYSLGRFSLSGQVGHRNTISYQGTLRESFDHSQDLSYQASNNLSVSVGHSLAGSVYRPNGQDTNLSLINEQDSTVYGSLTVTY